MTTIIHGGSDENLKIAGWPHAQTHRDSRLVWHGGREITACYSPEVGAGMRRLEHEQIQVSGLKLKAIATLFGIEGNPFVGAVFLALGRFIWARSAGNRLTDEYTAVWMRSRLALKLNL